jgi:GNAT superfamily N-acetyltransferase
MIMHKASAADIERLVDMMDAYYADHGREHPRSALRDFIDLHLEGRNRVCFTAGRPYEAVLTGTVQPHYHSGELTAFETLWLSFPGKSGYGAQLLPAFEEWARARGAKRIILSGRTARTCRLLELKKYRPLEMAFDKEL